MSAPRKAEAAETPLDRDPTVVPAERLELAGELTIQTAAERKVSLVEALDLAERSGAAELHLDLAEVTELDTAGLQLLLLVQREAAHRGCRVRLAAMSQAVTDVLAIAQFDAELDRRLAVAATTRTIDAQESTS